MSRQYDIVVFGATGHTGKLTAAYIARNFPTDIQWAVAGRSAAKLEAVVANCKALNADRVQPAIEICNLDDAELGDLARKTTVLISTAGPYALYGEYAFKACAENGTHYLDVTGEVPWVARMIKKYEKAAKTSGAVLIPQIGLESAPSDLVTWSLVSLIRRELSAPTGDVILSVHELRSLPSGGTLASAIGFGSHFTLQEIRTSSQPFALSPIPGPGTQSKASIFSRVLGPRFVPDLGTLSSSLQAFSDIPIVQRSWGILGGSKFYGPKFHVEQYMRTRNGFTGIMLHAVLVTFCLLLTLAPFRWLVKKVVYAPGDGPTEEQTIGDRSEMRGIAIPDSSDAMAPRAYCKAYFEGGMYHFTALLVCNAALTILRDDTVATKSGGGIFTPASLGQPFIDRLQKAGFKFETKFLPH